MKVPAKLRRDLESIIISSINSKYKTLERVRKEPIKDLLISRRLEW